MSMSTTMSSPSAKLNLRFRAVAQMPLSVRHRSLFQFVSAGSTLLLIASAITLFLGSGETGSQSSISRAPVRRRLPKVEFDHTEMGGASPLPKNGKIPIKNFPSEHSNVDIPEEAASGGFFRIKQIPSGIKGGVSTSRFFEFYKEDGDQILYPAGTITDCVRYQCNDCKRWLHPREVTTGSEDWIRELRDAQKQSSNRTRKSLYGRTDRVNGLNAIP